MKIKCTSRIHFRYTLWRHVMFIVYQIKYILQSFKILIHSKCFTIYNQIKMNKSGNIRILYCRLWHVREAFCVRIDLYYVVHKSIEYTESLWKKLFFLIICEVCDNFRQTMVKKCSVKGCENVPNHNFPKNEELRKRWIEACCQEKLWVLNKGSRICSWHFREDDYLPGMYKKKIS